jgi:hypothetical protein
MFGEKPGRFVHTVPFLRRDENHLRSHVLDLIRQRLKLSHASDAVRSPGPTQEFQNQISVLQQRWQTELTFAIRRVQ